MITYWGFLNYIFIFLKLLSWYFLLWMKIISRSVYIHGLLLYFQTVRTLIAIVLCYAILWLPLHVITILGALNKSLYDNIVVHIFWMVSQWLTVTTCCVNSIVFFCRNKKYRAFVQDIFKNQTTISLSRAWSTRSQRSRPTKSFSVQMSEN